MKKIPPETIILYCSMFVMGACGIAYEYTFSKIASDFLGNSVRQWAIIIGLMMLFMGIGSDLQKYSSDNKLFDKFIFLEIILGLLGGFGPILFLHTFGIYPEYYIIVQYFFIIAVGLLIGFEIPLLARINETYIAELKINIGGVLKMDYIGSFFGALVWIIVLPKFFTIIETAFVLAFFNLTIAGVTYLYFIRSVAHQKKIGLVLATSMLFIIVGGANAKNWTHYAEQYLYRDRIILSKTTPYQHIVMTRNRADDINLYINGNIQFSSTDEYIYHDNLVHPAFSLAPQKKNILILGGGDGLALREVLKYKEVESVTLCDIDPAMTELAKTNIEFKKLNKNSLQDSRLTILENHALVSGPSEDLIEADQRSRFQERVDSVGKVKIINMDADKFIEQISGRYDIIIIDFPDPNTLELSKLYSKKFYRNIAKKLSENGIIVQQSTSPIYTKEAFLCIGRTMKDAGFAVLPYHDNVPSFGEWGFWVGGKRERMSEKILLQRLNKISQIAVTTQYITPDLMRAALHFGKNQLNTDKNDTNTITNNVIHEYYLQGWLRYN